MDVDSLRNELEKHLAHNPDADAPQGFRARFDMAVEQYQGDGGGMTKEALETELQQIRTEAEAIIGKRQCRHRRGSSVTLFAEGS